MGCCRQRLKSGIRRTRIDTHGSTDAYVVPLPTLLRLHSKAFVCAEAVTGLDWILFVGVHKETLLH